MRCAPPCNGTGWIDRWVVLSDSVAGRRRVLRREPCPQCAGRGEVSCCEGAACDGGDAAEEAADGERSKAEG